MMKSRKLFAIAWLLAAVFAVAAQAADPADNAERKQAELDAHIAELIEQLGSPDFPVREKATRELIEIGLPAFDALQAAQFHRDLEIGLRAKYLVGSAQVAWSRDDDPPEIKAILKGYGQQPEDERRVRIARLGLVENRGGWPALCRLARYERDEQLSKQAALAIMTQDPPSTANIAETAKALQLGAGESRRQASQWLRAYARWLSEPETILSEWNRLVNEEFELLAEKDRTSVEVATKLGRWHAETLNRLGHAAETKAIIKRLAGLVDRAEGGLLDHVAWLGHRQMWSFVAEVYEQNAAKFQESPVLLYHAAEAQLRLSNPDAEKTAAQARAVKTIAAEHIKTAGDLSSRGLFDWAEGEYRTGIENDDLLTEGNVTARRQLAEMLHDREKERAAGEALEPIFTAMEMLNTDQFGKRQPNPMRLLLESRGYDPGGLMSRMHYFFALDHLKRGETEKAVERLNKGVKEDAEDADVLIALFRLRDQTDERRDETRRLIRRATESSRQNITEFTKGLTQIQAIPNADLELYKRRVAMAHNQFAWLVANTEGDFEAAVASSHESLNLRPGEPAYLDTLGRCYYAAGDLTNAIKYQSEAVRKEPHSGQMKRQLALFKTAAEKK